MYHVDQQFGVNQRVYWCELTPQKLPDENNLNIREVIQKLQVC